MRFHKNTKLYNEYINTATLYNVHCTEMYDMSQNTNKYRENTNTLHCLMYIDILIFKMTLVDAVTLIRDYVDRGYLRLPQSLGQTCLR